MSFHEQDARASVGYKAAIATAYKKKSFHYFRSFLITLPG